MDDVPAGPASPGPRRPPLSVVIPVHNGGRDFEHCLRRLRDSLLAELRADRGRRRLDRRLGRAGRVVRRGRGPQRDGPGPGRGPQRRGARPASAPFIFFLDADVAVHPETLGRVIARFDADPGLTALFGSYDDAPTAPGLVSQFRNLLHHYVHQQGSFVDDARPAHTFWTGCGAIRRAGLPRLRRLRPPALPPARDRGHRARLSPDPRRLPDRPGPRRPGDPPEALDACGAWSGPTSSSAASPGCS